ncbi:MAG TPA: PLP-dependent cysteine synthase family protein [Acidimicrobiales bacterium]|nr:PLP-dependent cysteine synthase family protein [Acidimicrobiales bacterium]
MNRDWVHHAIELVEADANRSADTHLITVPMPTALGVDVYLKDESAHPTGSLKHRLARSLVLYELCNGRIGPGTPLVECSSGSTAVSEAYFARLLGLAFTAVMPAGTSPEKIDQIHFYGGTCHLVEDPDADLDAEARRLADATDGCFLDQFTNAERATDWRGNNNIAESIFDQLSQEPHPVPAWVVVGAGTGGTSATIGRFVRWRQLHTRVCLVDPEGSVYADAWDARHASDHRADDASEAVTGRMSRIEGIGRPRVEVSFLPEVIDRTIRVPDAASVAAMRVLNRVLGRRVGASTGTNFWGMCTLIAEMHDAGERGSVVGLLCDGGDRYSHTVYDDAWLEAEGLDPSPYEDHLEQLFTDPV